MTTELFWPIEILSWCRNLTVVGAAEFADVADAAEADGALPAGGSFEQQSPMIHFGANYADEAGFSAN